MKTKAVAGKSLRPGLSLFLSLVMVVLPTYGQSALNSPNPPPYPAPSTRNHDQQTQPRPYIGATPNPAWSIDDLAEVLALNGRFSSDEDIAKWDAAWKETKSRAEKGDVLAAFVFARDLEYPSSVKEQSSVAASIKWYAQAANGDGRQNVPPAAYRLYQIYNQGVGGVPANPVVANQWYGYAMSKGLTKQQMAFIAPVPRYVPPAAGNNDSSQFWDNIFKGALAAGAIALGVYLLNKDAWSSSSSGSGSYPSDRTCWYDQKDMSGNYTGQRETGPCK